MLSQFYFDPVTSRVECTVSEVRYLVLENGSVGGSSSSKWAELDYCKNLTGSLTEHKKYCCEGLERRLVPWLCSGTRFRNSLLSSRGIFFPLCPSGKLAFQQKRWLPLKRHIRRGMFETDSCEAQVQTQHVCSTTGKISRETMRLGTRAIPWTDLPGRFLEWKDVGWSDDKWSLRAWWVPDTTKALSIQGGREAGAWLVDLMNTRNYMLEPLRNRDRYDFSTCTSSDLNIVWKKCGSLLEQNPEYCFKVIGAVALFFMSSVIYREFYDSYTANVFRRTIDISKKGEVSRYVRRSLRAFFGDVISVVDPALGYKLQPHALLSVINKLGDVYGDGPRYAWEKNSKGDWRVFLKLRVSAEQLQRLRRNGQVDPKVFAGMVGNFYPHQDMVVTYDQGPYVNSSSLTPNFKLDPFQVVGTEMWELSIQNGLVQHPDGKLAPRQNTLQQQSLPTGVLCTGFEVSAEVTAFSPLLSYFYFNSGSVPLSTGLCQKLCHTSSQPMSAFACEPFLDRGMVDETIKHRAHSCRFSVSFKASSPIRSFDNGLIFQKSKSDIGNAVCACTIADISSTTSDANDDVVREASRCFVSACDDPVTREEFKLFPETCSAHCELVGTWISSFGDLISRGKRLVGFDSIRYRNICKRTLEPNAQTSFNVMAAVAVGGVAVATVFVAALFGRTPRGRLLAAGASLALGAGLAVLCGFLLAGNPSCHDGRSVCVSKALGSELPLDLCRARLPCECTNSLMCGPSNECTEEGLCVNKTTGKRPVVSIPNPFRLQTIHAITIVPILVLSVLAGWGAGRTFLHRPTVVKLSCLSVLFLCVACIVSGAVVHFTSTPDQKYAPISKRELFADISFVDGTRVMTFPTYGAKCPLLEEIRKARSSLREVVGIDATLGTGWISSSLDGTRNAVFEIDGSEGQYLVVRYPPNDGPVDVMVSGNTSFDPLKIVCQP